MEAKRISALSWDQLASSICLFHGDVGELTGATLHRQASGKIKNVSGIVKRYVMTGLIGSLPSLRDTVAATMMIPTRLALDLLPVGVWLRGSDRVLYANRALTHLLGYKRPDEIVGRVFTEFFPPEIISAGLTALNGLMKAEPGQVLNEIVPMLHAEGRTITVEVNITRLNWADNLILATIADRSALIVDHSRCQHALAALRMAWDSSPSPAALIQERGIIWDCNANFSDLVGRKGGRAELVGLSLDRIFRPSPLTARIKNGEAVNLVIRIDEVPYRLRQYPLAQGAAAVASMLTLRPAPDADPVDVLDLPLLEGDR